jgi:hypothetical protein
MNHEASDGVLSTFRSCLRLSVPSHPDLYMEIIYQNILCTHLRLQMRICVDVRVWFSKVQNRSHGSWYLVLVRANSCSITRDFLQPQDLYCIRMYEHMNVSKRESKGRFKSRARTRTRAHTIIHKHTQVYIPRCSLYTSTRAHTPVRDAPSLLYPPTPLSPPTLSLSPPSRS